MTSINCGIRKLVIKFKIGGLIQVIVDYDLYQ